MAHVIGEMVRSRVRVSERVGIKFRAMDLQSMEEDSKKKEAKSSCRSVPCAG